MLQAAVTRIVFRCFCFLIPIAAGMYFVWNKKQQQGSHFNVATMSCLNYGSSKN